ncbi:hypothetical protein BGY98DRAFT_1192830 [Russula aff. rugulosa BPL654]|nr:hypothetical protein BGY98DRAFT_1192830 [Russula aff. rugulosa BPL654]
MQHYPQPSSELTKHIPLEKVPPLYGGRCAALSLDIIIIGAGIGGLAATHALAHAKHRITLLDRPPFSARASKSLPMRCDSYTTGVLAVLSQRSPLPRATATQEPSRLNQKIFHLLDGPNQRTRDDAMRAAMAAELAYAEVERWWASGGREQIEALGRHSDTSISLPMHQSSLALDCGNRFCWPR